MKLIRIIFILTLEIIFGVQISFACRCYTAPPPCYTYWKFDAVFVGTVKNVEKESPENTFMPKVEVVVEQNFKGMTSKVAYTTNSGTSCSFNYDKGDKFLFYADLDDEDKTAFGTGYCSRTQGFNENISDFDFFKTLNSSTPNYWIWGTISRGDLDSPIQGVKAEVLDNKKKLLGVSDKNGDLKIVVSKEGIYKVRVYIPKGAGFNISQWEEQRNLLKVGGKNKKGRYLEYEVEVKNNKCGWFDAVIIK